MFSRLNTYFDYASITPPDKRVIDIIQKAYKKYFYNPDALYDNAVVVKKIMEKTRQNIATHIHAHKDEIIFTSGGTESNNIAIQGIIKKWYEGNIDRGEKPHVIISTIEHPSIRNIIYNSYKNNLITYTEIDVDVEGMINTKTLKQSLLENKNTILISYILVNNEIGSIQNTKEINSIIRKYKNKTTNYPYIHIDACQALNYMNIDMEKIGVDMMTIDGGKIYGPTGIGVLYKKRYVDISPLYHGGDQEYGIRPATSNIPLICGLGEAFDLISKNKKERERVLKMQEYIFNHLSKIKNIEINGPAIGEKRICNNINMCFPGKEAEFLLFKLDVLGFQVSTGTTCQNKKEDSTSLSVKSIGKESCASSSLRISLGRYNTWSKVKEIVKNIKLLLIK